MKLPLIALAAALPLSVEAQTVVCQHIGAIITCNATNPGAAIPGGADGRIRTDTPCGASPSS